MIQQVGLSINRRFQSHKTWTYQQVSDLAQQMTDLSDLVREKDEVEEAPVIEGITNDTDTEETEEADTTE